MSASSSGNVPSAFASSDLPALTPAPFSMSTSAHGGGNVGSLVHPGVSHADSFNQNSSHHIAGSSSSASSHGQTPNHANMQGGFTSDDFKYPNHVSSAASSASQSHHSHYPHPTAAMAAAASAHHGYLTNPTNASGVFPYAGLADHSHHHYAKLNLQAS